VHSGSDLVLVYAQLRVACERIGHALSQRDHDADRWVAATALRLGIPLVSNDAIFNNVPGLALETLLTGSQCIENVDPARRGPYLRPRCRSENCQRFSGRRQCQRSAALSEAESWPHFQATSGLQYAETPGAPGRTRALLPPDPRIRSPG
jgi:hypothetical protein